MVNHQGNLYKLCYVGVGGSVLSILTAFLSNLSQHFMVDGYRSKLVQQVGGVQQGCALGPLPNQPHSLNKYQINMGFLYFHEIWILSGMNILATYQIDIVKGCGFWNEKLILI